MVAQVMIFDSRFLLVVKPRDVTWSHAFAPVGAGLSEIFARTENLFGKVFPSLALARLGVVAPHPPPSFVPSLARRDEDTPVGVANLKLKLVVLIVSILVFKFLLAVGLLCRFPAHPVGASVL